MKLLASLQLWRDVEMFQAFDLDEVLVVEDNSWHVSLREPLYPQVPWIDPDMWGLNPEYTYGFDLFIGIFEKQISHSVVRELYGQADFSEEFDDAREPEGTTCVARLGVSSRGEPLIEDCRISTHPWALTAIRRNQELSLDAFDAYGRDLLMRICSCRVAQSGEAREGGDGDDFEPLSWDAVRAINVEARRDLKLEWRDFEDRVVIVAHRLGKKRPVPTTIQQLESRGVTAAAATKVHVDVQPPESAHLTHEAAMLDARAVSVAGPRIRRRCEILNSFFLRDLQRVAQNISKLNKNSALSRYLSAAPLGHRTDVVKPSPELWANVAPKSLPLGRWLHDPTHFNALMQQLAINEYTSGKHPLFAVNGPPGTGKTTLVKDVVAAAVVSRALKLVRYRSADDAFEKRGVSCEVDRSRFVVRKLKRDLVGFEVVIASSNNNAVENITRQLPKRAGLGKRFQDSAYLPEVARLYEDIRTGRDSSADEGTKSDRWGLISVPLGNRRNREAFCDALLYGPREEKDEKNKRQKEAERLTLHEWRKQIPPTGTISFARARLDFLAAHKRVEELLGHLESQVLSIPHEAPADPSDHFRNPCDQDFDSLQVQERAPWLTERLNEAHSKLFLAALCLHQAWVREASALGPNLAALGKMLGRPDAFEERVAVHLWQTLFMVVPAISTTLASVERMFCNVREGVFGSVILEEAGQATPQSVAGLMWRAKRALVIGDPMQPVVSAPEVLVRHFCKRHKVANPLFSPLASSAQALADESNELGTYLDHSVASTWVGAPLRVHRRCVEPMFSIANTIAYSGLMTYGTRESEGQAQHISALPDSAWFDIGGQCVGRHWVPQHGAVAYRLLEQILRQQALEPEPDLFLITPFRSVREPLAKVAAECAKGLGYSKEQVASLRRRVGTVHTFQGKEASVVAFVLGCDESTRGAARWAGERPNLVNVAVTRAQHRLYVIGDLSLWHNQGFFSELANSLPRVGTEGHNRNMVLSDMFNRAS
jgi:hypothetical protein